MKECGYSFQTFEDFIIHAEKRVVVLRHDVDKRPLLSLKFAQIQKNMGIRGSYYFRTVPCSYDEKIIAHISSMGHEIGYHYETMDSNQGNTELAYEEFYRNLVKLRKLVPISTVCMHGSPMSKFDNRTIWDHYNYKELSILAEPYFDLDFTKVFYLTDTGRRFDGDKMSIRDKPVEKSATYWPTYHSTNDIIEALQNATFPEQAMITFHPQRWTENLLLWTHELLWQKCKNIIKKRIVNRRTKK